MMTSPTVYSEKDLHGLAIMTAENPRNAKYYKRVYYMQENKSGTHKPKWNNGTMFCFKRDDSKDVIDSDVAVVRHIIRALGFRYTHIFKAKAEMVQYHHDFNTYYPALCNGRIVCIMTNYPWKRYCNPVLMSELEKEREKNKELALDIELLKSKLEHIESYCQML